VSDAVPKVMGLKRGLGSHRPTNPRGPRRGEGVRAAGGPLCGGGADPRRHRYGGLCVGQPQPRQLRVFRLQLAGRRSTPMALVTQEGGICEPALNTYAHWGEV